MSRWTGGGAASSGRQFYDQPSGGASLRSFADPNSGTQPTTPTTADTTEGVSNVNLLDPNTGQIVAPIGKGLFDLQGALFGSDVASDGKTVGSQGKHGGFLGDVPLLGDIGRGITNVPGVIGQMGANALEDANLLERAGIGKSSPHIFDEKFAALPDSFLDTPVDPQYEADVLGRPGSETAGQPGVTTWRQALAAEKGRGLFGTEFASMTDTIKATAIRAYDDRQQFQHPELRNPSDTVSGSFMGALKQMADWFDAPSQAVERASAEHINRLQQIRDVEENGGSWTKGPKKTSDIEKLALAKVNLHEWTEAEANDFLTRHGAGYSHDPTLNVAGEVALDPLNLASFGAAGAAKLGVKGVEAINTANKARDLLVGVQSELRTAETALAEAKAAKGAGAAKALRAAESEVARLNAAQKTAEADIEAGKLYTASKTPGRQNVLARSLEGRRGPQALVEAAGRVYGGLEGTAIGKGAKATRYLLDPLHAIDLRMPGNTKLVDLTSNAVDKTMIDTLGAPQHMALLDALHSVDESGTIMQQVATDFSVGAKNRARELIMAAYVKAQVVADGGEALMTHTLDGHRVLPDDLLADITGKFPERDLLAMLRLDTVKNILIRDWPERAVANLSRQMEALYHGMPAADWAKRIEKMSIEQRSILKHAVYGNSNRILNDAIEAASRDGITGVGSRGVRDIILLARTTFTRVHADDLVALIGKTKSIKDKVALIKAVQSKYPVLKFIAVDEANPGRSVERFLTWMSDRAERWPMPVKASELPELGPHFENLQTILGDGYQLGFSPADEFKFGLERINRKGGRFGIVETPFVSHVADTTQAYMPAKHLTLNIAKAPIVGKPIKGAVKAVDYMAAGARVLKSQISGAQIAEMARSKFVSEASRAKFAEHGLTEDVAQTWWDTIQEFTSAHKGYTGARGFDADSLYKALEDHRVIPQTMLNGAVGTVSAKDIMRMVMEAYDGDLRYIGLTQKLTARAKAYLFRKTGSNLAGQVAEHLWPELRFHMNPIFQVQEKIEPVVWGITRGTDTVGSVALTEADKATERFLKVLDDNSIIRQADLDQAEWAPANMVGAVVDATAMKAGSSLNQLNTLGSSLRNVAGTKRINMLRTIRQGLGKELRTAWEAAYPGTWDDMKLTANVKARRVISEDEFALQVLGDNIDAYDGLIISRLDRAAGKVPSIEPLLKTAMWHSPTSLGEMQPIDLEHFAQRFKVLGDDGRRIDSVEGLRRYIAADHTRIGEVTEFLNRLGVDPDQAARIENALTFSWEGFWNTAAQRFSLSREDSNQFQNMIAQAASLRGVDPAEFLSQVIDPNILGDRKEAVIGELAKAKDLRSSLAGVAGESTKQDLIHQMAGVFAAYMDPSLKLKLLAEFKPEVKAAMKAGKIGFDAKTLKDLWGLDEESQLARRIIGYMDGKLGTGIFDDMAEARGVKAIRDGAAKYMADRGVTAQAGRRHYLLDGETQAHYDKAAEAYGAMKATPFEKTGRRPTTKGVYSADTTLRPKPSGVDDRTYEAYQDFMVDTKSQFDFMTRSKKDGGLGIKVVVARADPYADSAAMRVDVAKGQIRVLGSASDHALMTNEQNVMFRAVHDVFGHAAEGYELGPRGELNAAAKHAQMYSDTGRGALLTETHGQTAYNNFSNDIIPDDSFIPAKTYAEAKAAYAKLQADTTGVAFEPATAESQAIQYDYETAIGPGLDALSKTHPDAALAVMNRITQLRHQFPGAVLPHVDVSDVVTAIWGSSIEGIVIGPKDGQTALILNADMWTDPNYFARVAQGEADFAAIAPGELSGKGQFRQAVAGAPYVYGGEGPMGAINHEFGHVIDSHLRYGPGAEERSLTHQAYVDFADDFAPNDFTDEHGNAVTSRLTKARQQLSEYARESDEEAMAEMFSVALDPNLNLATLKPELRSAVEEFRGILRGLDIQRVNPGAGKSVREANLTKRGTYYGPQKVGLLPQDVLDEFGAKFVGQGKHVESSPDVARTAQMFGKWSQRVVENGLMKGDNLPGNVSDVLADVRGIPTDQAVPYDLTQGLLMQRVTQAAREKFTDANRLTYFAQERSFLERSLNHPMFGLYPASYMWGKVAPELIRFIAQKPFGIRTGGLAYSMMDVQASMAMEREFNPEFDAAIEKMGHSQAMSFLSYLLPGVPWELSASMPIWAKNLAQQGAKQRKLVAQGKDPGDINLLDPAMQTIKKLNPLETTGPWAERGLGELLGPIVNPPTPEEQRAADVKAAREAYKNGVTGVELGGPLYLAQQELADALR